MVEQVLEDYDRAYNLKYVSFRYFNAAGADPQGRLGEDHQPETHLIPLALLTALGKRSQLTVFGTDYPTPDGTCIRDYIHVCDLASAHVLGLKYLLAGNASNVFNLGNGNGFSVKQVLDTVAHVTGKNLRINYGDRRPGDPAMLVSSSDKAQHILNWLSQFSDLGTIVSHAWQWHQSRHGNC
jgi:UDP-glucose 4-epimerase